MKSPSEAASQKSRHVLEQHKYSSWIHTYKITDRLCYTHRSSEAAAARNIARVTTASDAKSDGQLGSHNPHDTNIRKSVKNAPRIVNGKV